MLSECYKNWLRTNYAMKKTYLVFMFNIQKPLLFDKTDAFVRWGEEEKS